MHTSVHRPSMRPPSRRAAVAATAATLALIGAAAHAFNGIESFTSGTPFFKRVVTNTRPQTTSSTSFIDLPGASTVVFVPPQTNVLIDVNFDAETRCSGGEQGQNWCEARILINGVEGSPQASTYPPDTFALDSTDGGTETIASWESHAFSRHYCLRNPRNAPLTVKVNVQWKVTDFTPVAPEFWIDDSSLVVQMSRDCTVTQVDNVPGQPGGAARATRDRQTSAE